MRRIKVLWIDDEWKKMDSFIEECSVEHCIDIYPYTTRKAGLDALEQDLNSWDAVILDAKVWDESENEKAGLKGMSKARDRLNELSASKRLPFFIFTGQPDLMSDDVFKQMVGKFYNKNGEQDLLIKDIKKAVQSSDEWQIKHKYKDVYDALTRLEIGVAWYDIRNILLSLHFPADYPIKPEDHYNRLRTVIEYVFRACNKVGLIPDQCIPNGAVNLNQCSLYIAGKEARIAKVKYDGPEIVPQEAGDMIKNIIEVTNKNSHSVNEETTTESTATRTPEQTDSFYKSNRLLFGYTLQICALIKWFSYYISKHNNREENLIYCKELKTRPVKGQVMKPEKDPNGNWHCGFCLVIIKPQSNYNGGYIKLKNVTDNINSKTNSTYPYYAKWENVEQCDAKDSSYPAASATY